MKLSANGSAWKPGTAGCAQIETFLPRCGIACVIQIHQQYVVPARFQSAGDGGWGGDSFPLKTLGFQQQAECFQDASLIAGNQDTAFAFIHAFGTLLVTKASNCRHTIVVNMRGVPDLKSTRLLALPIFALLMDAHPMGNFSVNHYSRLSVGQEQVEILYALDLAEIPTFELLQGWNLTAASPRKSLEQKAAQQMREWTRKLTVQSNGKTVHPVYESAELVVSDGAGNMPVMRITAKLRVPGVAGKLDYEDGNYPDRAGWKEVVLASGKGAKLGAGSVGTEDRSDGLKVYPQDATVAPPQVLKVSVQWTSEALPVVAAKPEPAPAPAPVAAALPPAAQAGGTVVRGDFLSELLSRKEISFSMILIGLAVAFGLGAMHAFSPGHGKTMVAAYLVGSRGAFKHAVFLGAMVTFTHTISVFALGFVTLFLSRYILPEQLYPVLGAISGITIVWIGGTLFFRRIKKLRPRQHHHHDHSHSHDHDHDHDHDHHHGPGGHTHVPEAEVTMGSLIALGASGGLVPCPSGLVILLSSIAIGRVGLGILLLVGFSAGLAVVLTAIGLLVVYAKSWLPDAQAAAASPAFRYIPIASAAVVVILGILMTGVSLGFIQPGRLIG